MPRFEQTSESLQRALAEIINQTVELPGVLLTITWVDLSPDRKHAKVGVSVLPEKFYGTALEKLRHRTGLVRQILAKRLKWRLVPGIQWEIDDRPKHVAELEEVFKQIEL